GDNAQGRPEASPENRLAAFEKPLDLATLGHPPQKTFSRLQGSAENHAHADATARSLAAMIVDQNPVCFGAGAGSGAGAGDGGGMGFAGDGEPCMSESTFTR